MRISGWSADVCASDLIGHGGGIGILVHRDQDMRYQALLGFDETRLVLFIACAQGRVIDDRIDLELGTLEFDILDRYLFIGKKHEIGRASCRESVCPYV